MLSNFFFFGDPIRRNGDSGNVHGEDSDQHDRAPGENVIYRKTVSRTYNIHSKVSEEKEHMLDSVAGQEKIGLTRGIGAKGTDEYRGITVERTRPLRHNRNHTQNLQFPRNSQQQRQSISAQFGSGGESETTTVDHPQRNRDAHEETVSRREIGNVGDAEAFEAEWTRLVEPVRATVMRTNARSRWPPSPTEDRVLGNSDPMQIPSSSSSRSRQHQPPPMNRTHHQITHRDSNNRLDHQHTQPFQPLQQQSNQSTVPADRHRIFDAHPSTGTAQRIEL